MSRIGKKPVPVPSGVKINHDERGRTVNFEGPKGKLAFRYRPEVSVEWKESEKELVCTIPAQRMDDGRVRAFWGTTRAQLQNMVEGVTKGYTRSLEIVGVGWNAKLMGQTLQLSVGYCNPVNMQVPPGVTVAVDGGTKITVSGPSKDDVGRFAAEIRAKRKPEPYNGKGVKYTDEVIQRKQGKAFGA